MWILSGICGVCVSFGLLRLGSWSVSSPGSGSKVCVWAWLVVCGLWLWFVVVVCGLLFVGCCLWVVACWTWPWTWTDTARTRTESGTAYVRPCTRVTDPRGGF